MGGPGSGPRPKPVRKHQLEGTYRPDRHGAAAELEDKISTFSRLKCSFCGERREWFASDLAERHIICQTCAEEAVELLKQEKMESKT
jgi:ribosomal protein S27E